MRFEKFVKQVMIVLFASVNVRQMVYTQRWTLTQNQPHSFTYTCNPGTVVQRLQRLPGSCLNRKRAPSSPPPPPPAVCADSQRFEISLLGKLVSMETRGSGVMMLLVEQQPWVNHGFQHTQNVIWPPEVCVYVGIFSCCTVWNLALIQLEIKCQKLKTEERTLPINFCQQPAMVQGHTLTYYRAENTSADQTPQVMKVCQMKRKW